MSPGRHRQALAATLLCWLLFWVGPVQAGLAPEQVATATGGEVLLELRADYLPPGDAVLETVFPTGTFDFPLALRHAGDGSGRRFVVERGGRIRVLAANGEIQADAFLDINDQTSTTGERGLLGLAFHPDFASNGLFYINQTAFNMAGITDGDTVIAELQTYAGNPNLADPTSRRNLIVIPQDQSNHNGGDLHFGADGYLYIGMGDGGGGNDPCDRGQTLDPATPADSGCRSGAAAWLLGKMLRIDVDNTTPAGTNNLCAAEGDGSAEYAVPNSNPFVGDNDACGEVWAYGLRNPYRFSFDRETGDLWISDVGQVTWEEVNLQLASDPGGHNYGWDVCEGSWQTGSTTEPCNLTGSTLPVIEYRRISPNCSVTGGYRYRGPFPSLQGLYAYGDYCSGQVWLAHEDDGEWVSDAFHTVGFGIVGFGEDEDGHLYLLRQDGEILRFGFVPEPVIFEDRFESPLPE